MAVSLRRLSLDEAAKLSFGRDGKAKPKESSSPFLDAAREQIEGREREHRGLIAYVTAFGKAGLIRPHSQESIDKAIMARALALLETELGKATKINADNRRQVAIKFESRLIELYHQERDRQLKLPGTAELATQRQKPEWLTDTTPAVLPKPASTVTVSQPTLPTLTSKPTAEEQLKTYPGLRPHVDQSAYHGPSKLPAPIVEAAVEAASDDDDFSIFFSESEGSDGR